MEKFNESQKIIRGGEKYILLFPVTHIRESHVNKSSLCDSESYIP